VLAGAIELWQRFSPILQVHGVFIIAFRSLMVLKRPEVGLIGRTPSNKFTGPIFCKFFSSCQNTSMVRNDHITDNQKHITTSITQSLRENWVQLLEQVLELAKVASLFYGNAIVAWYFEASSSL
jgi:hypothetical protein